MAVTYTYEAPDGDATVVEVTFTDGTIEHTRTVNAVFVDGVYDSDATETRVGEVAAGVEHKIAVGVISVPAEDPEAVDEE
jgi:hypothetical protein